VLSKPNSAPEWVEHFAEKHYREQFSPEEGLVGDNEVIVRLTDDGRWAVNFCGDTQIAKSGTLRFTQSGKLNLKTSHPASQNTDSTTGGCITDKL
jgi:hypothetical protein